MITSNLMFLESSNAQNKNEDSTDVKEINEIAMMETSLLFQAVEENNLASVRDILMRGTDPNVRDTNGRTPLIIAVRLENLEILLALLDARADPNMEDSSGNTPLTIALNKIYNSREYFNTIVRENNVLENMNPRSLLHLFTKNFVNENVFLIITALASYGHCQTALLEKSSGYEARIEETRRQLQER